MSTQVPSPAYRLSAELETAVEQLSGLLKASYPVARRAVALLLLAGDPEVTALVAEREAGRAWEIQSQVEKLRSACRHPFRYVLMREYYRVGAELAEGVVSRPPQARTGLGTRIGEWVIRPWPGIPILLLVLYLGLYQFVGRFGAGWLVGLLEEGLFERVINPQVNAWVAALPWPWLRELIGMEYGVVTLGLRYAVAIVLPVVGMFFLVFSLLEDSGYLPRLALLADRILKFVGLNGRAVIPLVLGLGCGTMATLVTRTLETRREKVIATLLLALGVPCSAQLGVTLALLSSYPRALLLWAGVVALVLALAGRLASRLLAGEASGFYLELPPLRWPRPDNVLTKTCVRMRWYFLEVLPIFLAVSVIIWAARLANVFDLILEGLAPLVGTLGLPPETAPAFLYGFFRRDYGVAGLYDLASAGALTPEQLLVACVVLTLFLPCVAQAMLMIRERGLKSAAAIMLLVLAVAFSGGYLLNRLILLWGIGL
ncbi:MAG: ferrous iron transporter B [Clostridia bacterium]|jgi:ferrous iron transport protein B|nr:ferrous iron transporter B [Clostridia bacterium]MDH7573239.1 ferrous iron transporter B [Clostridia bacterium]